jgi:hydrogenase maturation factor HypE
MDLELNIEEILNMEWDPEDKDVIERVVKHFKSWKRWIPSRIEKDIVYIIKLAIKEKKDLMELKSH